MSGSDRRTILAETAAAQARAADPAVSAWVSANAGAGKTYVLVLRVLRLLLAGAAPERILCLTYTKAAAAEMSNRLFDRLAQWTAMSDGALADNLAKVLGHRPDAATAARARTLFAVAIETPGGLKVQTIHSFCQRVLQRFPLEAGIAPNFAILDDETARALVREGIDATLRQALSGDDPELAGALDHVVRYAADDRFDEVIGLAVGKRAEILQLIKDAPAAADPFRHHGRALRTALGVGQDASAEATAAELCGLVDPLTVQRIVAALDGGLKTDRERAGELRRVLAEPHGERAVAAWRAFFLTSKGELRKSLVTKGVAAAHPDIPVLLERAGARFLALDQQLSALRLAEASDALLRIAGSVIGHYTAAKAERAALDYEDLVASAVRLIDTSADAQWVLYKLDGGIEHILVDEAQDTSPPQWRVIDALAEEFFAGAGTAQAIRTVFAVGDEKQSIYSFQGAAPELFARIGAEVESRSRGIGAAFHRVPLQASFRSVPAVLETVDSVFADAMATPGLTAGGDAIRHLALREGHGGRIELWPIELPQQHDAAPVWAPLDDGETDAPRERLAMRIARTIHDLIAGGDKLVSEGRPIRAGDILVLVRKRQPFAPLLIRELKRLGVPVSGADRIRITEQIAVEDLVALGSFVLLPEDDLALASVLKSPLIGLDDDDLFRIGHGRRGTLWIALLDRAGDDPRFEAAAVTLKAWRKRADQRPPFEFYQSVLEHDGGRARMLSRLGPEAGDAIDALMNLAIAYDEGAPPSLQGFLDWLAHASPEIRRDMDQGRDEVRVMTVHGAKGLEAPIVFLPDTCSTGGAGGSGGLVDLAVDDGAIGQPRRGPLAWMIKDARRIAGIDDARRRNEARERHEYHRLLYVALTRPRDRLYVAGFCGASGPKPGCWYELIERAVADRMSSVELADGTVVRRLETPQTAAVEPPGLAAGRTGVASELPEWARRPAPPIERRAVPLAPSRLAPLESEDDPPLPRNPTAEPASPPPRLLRAGHRFLRGNITHALLQHLPGVAPQERLAAARGFVTAQAPDLPPVLAEEIVRETLAVIEFPGFADLFSDSSMAEVPIAAAIPVPGRPGTPLQVSGQIDRLAVTTGEVTIVDFKTNRPPPVDPQDIPAAYLLQLAAYRMVLREVYPRHRIRAALLWTDGPRLMPVDDHILDNKERDLLALVP